jgi:hypothetical protein
VTPPVSDMRPPVLEPTGKNGSAGKDEDADQAEPRAELPRFPLHALPAPLRALAEAVESAAVYPADFVGVFGIAVLGAAAGGRWEVEVQPGWWERPIIWTAVIAGTGQGKSPALDAVVAPLRAVESELWRAHQAEVEDWKTACQATPKGEPKPGRPVPARRLVGDTTMEKLVRLLAAEPAGLLLAADELRSVIAGLNQYKSGKGSDRAHLLELWAGVAVTLDRVAEGGTCIRAERPALCLTGGIQPAVASALDGEDGLPSRHLLAYPAPWSMPWKRDSAGLPASVLGAWSQLVRDMLARRPEEVKTVPILASAQDTLDDAGEHYTLVAQDPSTPTLVAELARKLPRHLARIALALYVARTALTTTGAPAIETTELNAARSICDYFLAHAAALPLRRANLLASRAEAAADEGVALTVEWLRARSGGRGTRRELQRARVAGVRTAADVDRLLARYGDTYPRCIRDVPRPNGGLPTRWVKLEGSPWP